MANSVRPTSKEWGEIGLYLLRIYRSIENELYERVVEIKDNPTYSNLPIAIMVREIMRQAQKDFEKRAGAGNPYPDKFSDFFHLLLSERKFQLSPYGRAAQVVKKQLEQLEIKDKT